MLESLNYQHYILTYIPASLIDRSSMLMQSQIWFNTNTLSDHNTVIISAEFLLGFIGKVVRFDCGLQPKLDQAKSVAMVTKQLAFPYTFLDNNKLSIYPSFYPQYSWH